ncbi:alpha/beta hydrolase [Kribbella sp. NPDC051620]|uniref:alpha/beta hydrolase n=1 Tax=Kribbella sp. NPDC051620 TaxID=3364120 RepID=UPI00378EB309
MRTNVTFDSAGLQLAGHLYLPDNEPATRRPAIVIGHPGTGVKEQAAGLYAERLARAGFITLAFDAAYQGESEGFPRGLEDPGHRVEDFKAAVSFLSVHDQVDPDRIGALGICASGGYVIPAAATDHRIKAVATVSAVDISRQFREGADGRQDPAIIQSMLATASTARTSEAHGESIGDLTLFPESEEEARAGGRHVFEGWEYYRTDRARHPRSAKAMPWSSVDRITQFDAFRFISLIGPRPLLMIAGREAVTSWMTTQAFEQASHPKELLWIDGASHVDLYDKDKYVTPAVAKLTDFYRSTL